MSPAELYACLYAAQFPMQALLRLRPDLRARPCAVMEGTPPLQNVCALNSLAHALGVAVGMTQVEMDTFPSVTALPRSRAEEAATKAALLECAAAFSPRVESLNFERLNEERNKGLNENGDDRAFFCVIDIAGTQALFGAPEKLALALLERVGALGIRVRVAVSCNFHAAICLARAGSPKDQITVIPSGKESVALAPLPLKVLELSAERAETFSLWGIHSLGMLAALPEKSLIARMGQEGKRLSQLARGSLPHLFLPDEPSFKLEEYIELESPVEVLTSLLFVIGGMLEQLIVRASARTLALAAVTIGMVLEGKTVHVRTVRPALPSNDRQLWIKLIHLDLEAHPPQSAILALTVSAEPGSTRRVQLGLFSTQLPEPGRFDVTLARIRSIVGENNAGRAVLSDTHQPGSFRIIPFSIPAGTADEMKTAAPQARVATRQFRPPEKIDVTWRSQEPSAFSFRGKFYVVEHAYGPWIGNGEWWNPALWQREEWDLVARSAEDGLLYCCVTRDLARNCWLMVALYD